LRGRWRLWCIILGSSLPLWRVKFRNWSRIWQGLACKTLCSTSRWS
jgi:hypothetical protein